MKDGQVIYIAETLTQSVLKDLVSFLTAVGVVGMGVLLESQAMQWVGAGLWVIMLIGVGARVTNGSRMSPQDAADKLLKDYKVRAKENNNV